MRLRTAYPSTSGVDLNRCKNFCEKILRSSEIRIAKSDLEFVNPDFSLFEIANPIEVCSHRKIDSPPDVHINDINKVIVGDITNFRDRGERRVFISDKYGIISQIERMTVQLYIEHPQQVPEYVVGTIFTFLRDELKAEEVTTLAVDTHRIQAALSCIKAGVLIENGALPEVDEIEKFNDTLENFFPGAFDVLDYVSALLIFAPQMFAVPISYYNVTWVFHGDGLLQFPRAAIEGIYQEFLRGNSPLSYELTGISGPSLGVITQNDRKNYLFTVVRSINNAWSFALNPINFSESDTLDFNKQAKFIVNLHLILYNQMEINITLSALRKTTLTLNNMDRIANLVCGFNNKSDAKSESSVFSNFVREKFILASAEIFIKSTGLESNLAFLWGKYARLVIKNFNEKMFNELHLSENDIPSRIRSFRNLNHGAFLSRKQFEELAIHRKVGLPNTINDIMIIHLFALLSDPKTFINSML